VNKCAAPKTRIKEKTEAGIFFLFTRTVSSRRGPFYVALSKFPGLTYKHCPVKKNNVVTLSSEPPRITNDLYEFSEHTEYDHFLVVLRMVL